MLYGIIDIGSNTIRLSVYDVDERTGDFTLFFKLKTMAGLVSYIDPDTRKMSDAGVEKLERVLADYLRCTSKFRDLKGPYVFATAGVRNAKNAKDVVARVDRALGLSIDLVSGKDEASLGYEGAMRVSDLRTGVQLDVGGGSSEVTTFRNGRPLNATSIPVGSLSLFDRFVHGFLPVPAEADRIRAVIDDALERDEDFNGFSCKNASGVGGSARVALRLRDAWVGGDRHAGRAGRTITAAEIAQVLERVSYDPHRALRDILQIAPERAHTCIPGIVVIQTVMRHFGCERMEVNDSGVREGYLMTRVLGRHGSGRGTTTAR